jgi:hypothetical protein
MKRDNTVRKEQKIIHEFHRLLRGGQDLCVAHMYEHTGKKFFLSGRQTQDIVREYYKKKINIKMQAFIGLYEEKPHEEKVALFSQHFKMCERESRLIINYVIRK